MADQKEFKEVEVQYLDPAPMLNPQDLAELGALQVLNGMTVLETRAFIAECQQLAAQMALASAPKMLDRIRQIQEKRFLDIYARIRLLPNAMGWVRRDSVLAIIQSVAAQAPKQ